MSSTRQCIFFQQKLVEYNIISKYRTPYGSAERKRIVLLNDNNHENNNNNNNIIINNNNNNNNNRNEHEHVVLSWVSHS